MSIYYNKTHGITFWDMSVGSGLSTMEPVNTWEDFYLIPVTRPDVVSGEAKTNVVTIPGTNHRVDITDSMPGGLKFGQRQGTWEFYIDHDRYRNWVTAYNTIVNAFHGKQMMLCLDDDPTKLYNGMITVTGYNPGKDYSTITLQYDLDYGYWDFTDADAPVPPSSRFDDNPNIYRVIRFFGRTGSLIDRQYRLIGQMPDVPGEPAESGYTFTGWSPPVHKVNGNQDYRAQYTKDPESNDSYKSIKYRFMVPDKESVYALGADYGTADYETTLANIEWESIDEGEVKKGETPRVPSYSSIPKIEHMKFKQWTPDVKPLKQDTEFRAEYEIVETPPDHIWIAIHPTKMIYIEGEALDLAGIKVEALNEDGSLWKSAKYPKAVIPIEELTAVAETTVYDQNGSGTCVITVTWAPVEFGLELSATYTIGVVQAPPDHIRVAIHPTKMLYAVGDTIDYTGIQVEALNADGSLWTSSRYPDGIVPFNELIFPVTELTDGMIGLSSDLRITSEQTPPSPLQMPIRPTEGSFKVRSSDTNFYSNQTSEYYSEGDGKQLILCFITEPQDPSYAEQTYGVNYYINLIGIYASKEDGGITAHRFSEYTTKRTGVVSNSHEETTTNYSFTYNNKTVYYCAPVWRSGNIVSYEGQYTEINRSDRTELISFESTSHYRRNLAWTLIYGTPSVVDPITVQWNRPVDNQTLSATFEIGYDGEE